MNNTHDLSKFGYRMLDMAADLLKLASNGSYGFATQADYDAFQNSDTLQLEFNPNSGFVFLSDADFQVFMENNDGKLEQFMTCMECGAEGFKSEILLDQEGMCDACAEEKSEMVSQL